MDQIKKITDFLGNLYPHFSDGERHAFKKSNYTIPKEITRWWNMSLQDFVNYVHKTDGGEGMFAYVKSCQYTDFAIEELKMYKFNIENQEIKDFIEELNTENKEFKSKIFKFNIENQKLKDSVQDLNTENQELKSLIYGMLDEINELKEHNKSLSERIELLENKPPIILY
jgi:FtsZ-binding cell division protein ZapB